MFEYGQYVRVVACGSHAESHEGKSGFAYTDARGRVKYVIIDESLDMCWPLIVEPVNELE